MKALVVVFVLGAVFLCGNASFIEHVLNHTRLRGNMVYNTTEGVKLGYNGKLSFNNGIVGFDIVDLGGSFKAVPKDVSKLGNHTAGALDYTGDIQVTQGQYQANAAVDGTAGLLAEWRVNDNKTGVQYNATLLNRNQWKANGGGYSAQGNHGANLRVQGGGCNGNGNGTYYVGKRLEGGIRNGGNITGPDGTTTAFANAKWGRAGIKKRIHVNTQSNTTLFGNRVPTVAYDGVAGFQKGSYGTWLGNYVIAGAKGGSLFSGLVWADKTKNDDNSTTHKVHHVSNADYGFKGGAAVNDVPVALFGGVGTVSKVGGVEVNVTADKTQVTLAAGELGDLHHVGVVKKNPTPGDEIDFEQQIEALKGKSADELRDMEIEELTRVDSNGRPVRTFVHAQWAAGKGVEVNHNNGTVDVATRGGARWRAIGIDTEGKKPWHVNGSKTYNSTFVVNPAKSTVKNIEVRVGNDTQMIDIIQKKLNLDQNEMKKLW